MTDWIAWTRCPTCGFSNKDVFQNPDDGLTFAATPYVGCPKCAGSARYITFPAFEIQTFEVSSPGDAIYDTIDC
jgi:hypothetical protein